MLKILSVSIDNFFSFKEKVSVDDLSDITTFVGPNNAGKSNFIRWFLWYKNLLTDYSYPDLKTKSHKKNVSKPFRFTISYKFINYHIENLILNNAIISHYLTFENGIRFNETFVLTIPKKEAIPLLRKSVRDDGYDCQFQSDMNLEEYINTSDKTSDNHFDFNKLQRTNLKNYTPFKCEGIAEISYCIVKEIINFINRWEFLQPTRRIESTPRSMHEDIDSESAYDKIDSRGNTTSVFLQQKHSDEPQETVKAMQSIANIFDLENIRSTDDRDDNRKIKTFAKDRHDIESSVEFMGSGFEQTIIMGSYILLSKKNSVFFIEEPEVHLHPKLQRRFLNLIKGNAQENYNQFFLTTHSTIFSQIEDQINTFLVTKESDSSNIRKLSREDLQQVKEILGHKNSDIFGYDAVLFVEGPTEENAFPLLATILDMDIFKEGIGIFNSKGYGNMIQVKNIVDMLKSTNTRIYALYDCHEKDQGKLKDIEKCIPVSNRVKLPKSFEDCFENDILINALKNLMTIKEKEFGKKFESSVNVETLKKDLDEKSNKFETISKYYNSIVNRTIDKAEYGTQIALSIKTKFNNLGAEEKSKYNNELFSREPFKLLNRIYSDLNKH